MAYARRSISISTLRHKKRWYSTGATELDALELLGQLNSFHFPRRYPAGGDHSFDPYAYVISKNIRRRHLNVEERQGLLVTLIARSPEKSNRQIGKEIGVDHKTVGRARTKGEELGRIPQLEKTVGLDGKERPARRHATEATVPEDTTPHDPTLDEGTLDEMRADPATYWDDLTYEADDRLKHAYHNARQARNNEDHAGTAHALGELIAAATELKEFYENHLLGQRPQ